MSNPESTTHTNVTRNGLLTALAQAAVMIAGGINAIIIGTRYPASAETDSLFTAFALYSIWTMVAASVRTALVSRLLDREQRFRRFDRAIAATFWTLPVIVLLQVVIGIPLINLVSDADATIGSWTLVLLTPTAFLLLLTSVAAAMFAVLDDFAAAARAFAVGGLLNVAVFVALEPPLGLIAMPIAALISTTGMAAMMLHALRKDGWRPHGAIVSPLKAAFPWLSTIVLGSAYGVGTQVMYLISMVFATTSLAAGSATVYTYAYMAMGLVMALSTSSGAMALAAPVADSWEGDARALIGVEDDVTRSLAVLIVAIGGVAATAGTAIAGPLLPGFTAAEISQLAQTTTLLCLVALGSAVTVVPLVAMFAAHRYGKIAVVTLISLPLLGVLTAGLLAIDQSLASVAIAASMAVIALAWGILWLCHGARTPGRIAVQLWQVSLVALPAIAAYWAADQLIVSDGGFTQQVAAALAGTAIFGAFVAVALPSYRDLLLRMFKAALGGAA